MPVDLTKPVEEMSDSDIEYLASFLPENVDNGDADESIFDQDIQVGGASVGTLGDIGAGVLQGATTFARNSLAVSQALVERLGLPTVGGSATSKQTRQQTQQLRERFRGSKEGSLLGRGGELVGEYAPSLVASGVLGKPAQAAATGLLGQSARFVPGVARDVAGAEVLAGLQGTDPLQAGVGAAAFSGVVRGIGAALPRRTPEFSEFKSVKGLSRSQVLGRDTRPEDIKKLESSIGNLSKNVDDVQDMGTILSKSHAKIIKQYRKVRNRVYRDVFKGTDEAGIFPFKDLPREVDDVVSFYNVPVDRMSVHMQNLIKDIKSTMRNKTIKEADAIVRGPIKASIDTIMKSKNSTDILDVEPTLATQLVNLARNARDDALDSIGKKTLRLKAKETFEKVVRPILGNKQINSLFQEGRIDDLTRALTTPTKRKLIPHIFKTLDPEGQRALESGLIKNIISKFEVDEVLNAKSIARQLSQLRGNAGGAFSKQTNEILKGISAINKAILTADAKQKITDVAGLRQVKQGILSLLDTKTGIRLLTRASKKSQDSKFMGKLVNAVIDVVNKDLSPEMADKLNVPTVSELSEGPTTDDLINMPEEEFQKYMKAYNELQEGKQ